ncbi:copper chaperone PCu(A)C [Bradyrhizobium sp.]|uniref:copper chaperone PCu(A)C n=1 Tax=Bradyrhizobium sp. TaxID=376 RepID=UPI0023A49EDC|nr:copper chaperone PCu(A)C [Bradyrhizobium sp.]MDE2378827.1 copper chaperone PCu(A)C [Bradyrhizobium sp.]
MKLGIRLIVSMVLVGALHGAAAQAQEVKQGDLVISQAWTRAAPKGAESTSSYLIIENKGAAPERLLGGSTDAAEKIQVEQVSPNGLSVNPVDGGLVIAPGDKMTLAPGGYRLGLVNVKTRLKKGTKLPLTLQFEKAGAVAVSFDVLAASSKGPALPKDDKTKK